MATPESEGYVLLSKNVMLKEESLPSGLAPRCLGPVTLRYSIYLKIISYTEVESSKFNLVEYVYMRDMSEEIDRRKKLPKFQCLPEHVQRQQVTIKPVSAHEAAAQTLIETDDHSTSIKAKCRNCQGPHFTYKCPLGSTASKTNILNTVPTNSFGNNSIGSAPNMGMVNHDYVHSIKVINLPRNCTEDDWRQTIQSLQSGCYFRIRMIGRRHANFNGTCIISYKTKAEADQGLRIFNKFTYGSSVLDCMPIEEYKR